MLLFSITAPSLEVEGEMFERSCNRQKQCERKRKGRTEGGREGRKEVPREGGTEGGREKRKGERSERNMEGIWKIRRDGWREGG